jgi:hypothetical protein
MVDPSLLDISGGVGGGARDIGLTEPNSRLDVHEYQLVRTAIGRFDPDHSNRLQLGAELLYSDAAKTILRQLAGSQRDRRQPPDVREPIVVWRPLDDQELAARGSADDGGDRAPDRLDHFGRRLEDVPQQPVQDDEDYDRPEAAATEFACSPPGKTAARDIAHDTVLGSWMNRQRWVPLRKRLADRTWSDGSLERTFRWSSPEHGSVICRHERGCLRMRVRRRRRKAIGSCEAHLHRHRIRSA